MDNIAPPTAEINSTSLFNSHLDDDNTANQYLTESFLYDELTSALNTRRETSPGLDNITYSMIKVLNKSCKTILLTILNELWRNGQIPETWKTSCIIPILKPNKPKNIADSYRPIALTSCIGKIFEQLVKQRLEFYIESNNILPYNQYGFRKGKGTMHAISQLYTDVLTALKSNQYIITTFLDIRGAFDNVDLCELYKILSELRLPGILKRWLFNLLYNRLTYIKFNGRYYGPRRVFKGVIQGGILSPLIYLLYQYKMNVALGSVVKNIQYADDLTLYSAHSSFSSAVYNMNKGLTSLQQYLTNLSFEVNIEKSACIVFNTKCKKRAIISYCNRPIKIVNKFKFLGMIFDQSLNWKAHIEKIYVTTQRAINILDP